MNLAAPLGLRSLWAETAVAAPATGPLAGDADADVAIVGGGLTGISAALHLAEAGRSVVLLEAEEIGWGASGRNGGQVNPGFKYDPPDARQHYPEAVARAVIGFSGHAPDLVFDLIGKHKLACDAVRPGWLQPAHNPRSLQVLERRATAWQALGVKVHMLDKAATAAALGSDRYVGALLDPRGGSVQPLSYARELARAAIAAGARIHTRTRATRLEQHGGAWSVATPSGTIRAGRVVVGTNAYTDGLVPKLQRSLIAANSFQVATSPLGHNLASSILPGGHTASDTRRIVLYFRKDQHGRVVIGGRGKFAEPRGPEDYKHLRHALKAVFPQLSEQPISFHWSGRVAMTADGVPHIHEPEPGLTVALGYNGRGIAMATSMGRALAEHCCGQAGSLPFPVTGIRGIPFHELRRAYVGFAVAYFMARDAI